MAIVSLEASRRYDERHRHPCQDCGRPTGRFAVRCVSCSVEARRVSTPVEPRFWPKVDQTGGPDACWPWMACRNRHGYGKVGVGGISVTAHRAVWELANGPIPAGLHVLHRCDNPPCVNPAHLFLGTNADNVEDKVRKGRSCAGERSGRYRHGRRVGVWARSKQLAAARSQVAQP